MDALLLAIDDVLELLDNCIQRTEFINKFQCCKQQLLKNPKNEKALHNLYILSAPKGFLGDAPLYPKQDSSISEETIERLRWELVERIHKMINERLFEA